MTKQDIAKLLLCAEVCRKNGLIDFNAMEDIAKAVIAGGIIASKMGDNDRLVIEQAEKVVNPVPKEAK